MIVIGIDTGGTFTDFIAYDGATMRVHKQLSTPSAPEEAIIAGLAQLGIALSDARVVHGSTVATNTLLEGKGARTVFITNRGFGDTLSIGRQARPSLYDLTPIAFAPPVVPELCLETGGRLGANGDVVDELTDVDLIRLNAQVAELAPAAVAISLLFSFLDPRFEQAIAESLPDGLFISTSSDVLPEYREYERGIATWLNASTGPVMRSYLRGLAVKLGTAGLTVMQSSAVTCDPEFASEHAVNLLLSGPAGGLLGAQHIARAAGIERLMTFDMGGTSTDVALIDGEIGLTTEGLIGRYPVGVPMVDMHTIGAGGGSIAACTRGGLLTVGPTSAGAVPGPACYGAGGTYATVTDANLYLGRIPANTRLGGCMTLDRDAACAALARLADALGGVDLATAARGVIDLVNDHMRQALRVISVERGVDPREFTLISFGGAGGLHVCALAQSLGMRRALVPVHAGVLSALGMVVARPGRRLSRTLRTAFSELDAAALEKLFAAIAEPGIQALEREGHLRGSLNHHYSVDVCYIGQSFAINVAFTTLDSVAEQFHSAHEKRYGHRLDYALELVNVRVALDAQSPRIKGSRRQNQQTRMLASDHGEIYPTFQRAQLAVNTRLAGPAIVYDDVATAFIDPGWHAHLDELGNLVLEMG